MLSIKDKLLIIVITNVISKYSNISKLKESFVNKEFHIVTNKSYLLNYGRSVTIF
jgi:hypothetical protein